MLLKRKSAQEISLVCLYVFKAIRRIAKVLCKAGARWLGALRRLYVS